MKVNSPRYVGVGHCHEGGYKLTVIAQDHTVQELVLTLDSARKLAEDFLLAAMDLAAVEKITQMGNTKQADMFADNQ